MTDRVSNPLTEAREHLDALLALSDVPLVESGRPDPTPAALGAIGGWRFASPEHGVEADVYVFDDAQRGVDGGARLVERSTPQDDRGLPAVGSNGALVYVVRSASDASVEDAYAALGVAGALGGEEE